MADWLTGNTNNYHNRQMKKNDSNILTCNKNESDMLLRKRLTRISNKEHGKRG